MRYIIVNEDNVVVYITDQYTIVDGWIDVGCYKFIQPGLTVIEPESIPDYVLAQTYCYNRETGEFYPNPSAIGPLDNYYTKAETDALLDSKATYTYVDEEISKVEISGGNTQWGAF